MYDRLKIISGNGNVSLAKAVADCLHEDLVPRVCDLFPNNEVKIKILDSVAGADVYLFQSTVPPHTHRHYMEAWLLGRTLIDSEAERVSLVIPYAGYARQDRKIDEEREPFSFKFIADVCTKAVKFHRYIFVDLHNPTTVGFFDAPSRTTNLSPVYLLREELSKREGIEKYVATALDAGGTKRTRKVADILNLNTAYIDKQRGKDLKAKAMCVVGDVKDKDALIIEDIVDTGGTLEEGVTALRSHYAKKIVFYATHPLLTAPAIERINNSGIDELIITDTLPLPEEKRIVLKPKITVLSWAQTLAAVIDARYRRKSISASLRALYNKK